MARVWKPIKLHRCADCGAIAEWSVRVIKAGDSRGQQYYCSEHKAIWEEKYWADCKEAARHKQPNHGRNWSSVGVVGIDAEASPYQRAVSPRAWAGRMRRFFK